MKKIKSLFFLIFFLVVIAINLAYNQKEYENFINDLIHTNGAVKVSINGIPTSDYETIKGIMLQDKVSFLYQKQSDEFAHSDYKIVTNLNNVRYDNQNIDLTKSCLAVGNKVENCTNLKGFSQDNYQIYKVNNDKLELDAGTYYFWGDNSTEFLKEINPLIQNSIKPLKVNFYKYMIFLLTMIILLIIVLIIIVIYQYNSEEYKRTLLVLYGYSKGELQKRYLLNFLFYTIGIAIIVNIFSIIYFRSGVTELIYISILEIIIIIINLFNIASIIYFKTAKNINYILKNKNNLQLFNYFLLFFKALFLIIFLILFMNITTNIEEVYLQYKEFNHAYNVRHDYAYFPRTNRGLDTEEYFVSDEFQESFSEVSKKFYKENPDYDYLYVSPGYDENYKYLNVNPKYLEYNQIYDENNQKITNIDKNSCYYLIPKMYKGKNDLNLDSDCENFKTIYIADNQILPSYMQIPDKQGNITFGEMKNWIINITPNSEINKFAEIDGVFLPLDSNGVPKKADELVKLLKEAGVYDNVNKFKNGDALTAYLFKPMIIIIKILLVLEILLFIVFLLIINLVLENYFQLNYQKIILYKLQGSTVLERYQNLFKTLGTQMIFEVLIANIVTPIKIYNSISFVISVVVIYGIIFGLIIFRIYKLENQNINQILKGFYD